jgi:hypothetical protein
VRVPLPLPEEPALREGERLLLLLLEAYSERVVVELPDTELLPHALLLALEVALALWLGESVPLPLLEGHTEKEPVTLLVLLLEAHADGVLVELPHTELLLQRLLLALVLTLALWLGVRVPLPLPEVYRELDAEMLLVLLLEAHADTVGVKLPLPVLLPLALPLALELTLALKLGVTVPLPLPEVKALREGDALLVLLLEALADMVPELLPDRVLLLLALLLALELTLALKLGVRDPLLVLVPQAELDGETLLVLLLLEFADLEEVRLPDTVLLLLALLLALELTLALKLGVRVPLLLREELRLPEGERELLMLPEAEAATEPVALALLAALELAQPLAL